MKEYKVKEVADLLDTHEDTINVGYGQASSLTRTEIMIKKIGELLNLIY